MEVTSRAFDAWAYARAIKIEYIQTRKPTQNCVIGACGTNASTYTGSCSSRQRDEPSNSGE